MIVRELQPGSLAERLQGKDQFIAFRVSRDLKVRLFAAAEAQGMALSQWLRDACVQQLPGPGGQVTHPVVRDP